MQFWLTGITEDEVPHSWNLPGQLPTKMLITLFCADRLLASNLAYKTPKTVENICTTFSYYSIPELVYPSDHDRKS